ncbi:MAG: hypothetical protein ACI9EK_001346 [Psychroserpens sp.]|jgi:hypothetical protein
MAKVYRLHKDKQGSGWFTSSALSQVQISSISAAGMNAKKIATSIPSPFARIDLVKNAFNEISKDGIGIIGDTNNHKLISDALDVAQLFFHFDKVKNKYPNAEIIDWDPTKHIAEMKNIPATNMLGETIDLFWNQDGKSYNFDKLNRLFILKVNHKVIGATSPATLFFAAPDVSENDIDFQFDSVKLFDSNYESIIERDDSFIGFIYALYKQQSFATNFPEVYEYLKKALIGLKNSKQLLWNKVNGFDSNTLVTNFTQLEIKAGNPVEIIGMPVCLDIPGALKSDFELKSTIKEGKLPLALPIDKFHKPWIYTDSPWDSDTIVPHLDNEKLDDRILPGQARKYPYLTLGDFLEENIIKIPYSLNSEGIETFGSKEYLSPIKPLLFEYFTVSELKNIIEIDETIIGGVQVKLNIPTKKGEISYSKIYYDNSSVRERDFHCAIYPTIKVTERNINYHVGLFDMDESSSNSSIKLNFGKQGEASRISVGIEETIRKAKIDNGGSIHYRLGTPFDYIQVQSNDNVNAIVIPKFSIVNPGNTKASIAIDFGTTNTHVEYRYENGDPISFNVNNIYTSLSDGENLAALNTLAERILRMELYPNSIGNDQEVNFPLRTALLENNGINWGANPKTFSHSNIAYYYESINTQAHHKILTDLKWGDMSNSNDKLKTRHFIEGLLEGVKNKLLLEGVDFSNLDIKWLYPVSMTAFQLGGFDDIWKEAVSNILGQINSLVSIPESITPYNYYNNNEAIMGLTASIDIGGGTTDIAILDNDGPKFISSVNFAGNHVIGDGYNSHFKKNGFFKTFEKDFTQNCDDKDGSELISIVNSIKKGHNPSSSNLNSFLFSVDNNIYNFTDKIKNEGKQKFLFIVFYSAQAFYLAKSMKALGLNIPNNVIFSGAGSKSLNIIDYSNMNQVEKMYNHFFNTIYETESSNINIDLAPNPKEITAKGALYNSNYSLDNITGFWSGDSNLESSILFNEDNETTYEDVKTEDFKNSIINSIEEYYSILDMYFKKTNILNTYGIKNEVLELFEKNRHENLKTYLDFGIKMKIDSAQDSKLPISEGLFFYPFVGLINNLGFKLSELQ